jgi:hypothetical protein
LSSTVFSFPGKAGDSIHQWPVAWWWAKENGKRFTCWMDERSCKVVAPLFAAQPCVEKVEFKPGIEHYNCGGQPWHFDLPASEYENVEAHHLGLRNFPQRQLTLEALHASQLGLSVTQDQLAETPTIEAPGEVEGFSGPRTSASCTAKPSTRTPRGTPKFWTFISDIAPELSEMFHRLVFVGNDRDREVAKRTIPMGDHDDHGSFLELAKLMRWPSWSSAAGPAS